MTRAELEALALRVETEEPSRELDAAIAHAIGQQWTHPLMEVDPVVGPVRAPRFCSSLDAAALLLGRTWMATITDADDEWFVLLEHPLLPDVSAYAPAEPQARTAAALRALAMEQT